jgi:alpha-beta hydrolase superfamily lysophospholipase
MAISSISGTTFWRLAGAVALCLGTLVGCASLDSKQGQWIFNPSQRSWGDSATVAGNMQEAWISYPSQVTGQAVKLHTLVHPSAQPNAPVMLYLHGARWNVSGSAYRIQRMQELGFTVVAVDYRGFGKTSAETPSEKMAYEDAQATWQWIATTYPGQPRYIFGHSLGGAIAIELASKVADETGTIVEGTFTSIPDVASSMRWGWLPFTALITQRFDSIKKVASIGSPLLVVHGSNDQLIKPALGRKLFDAAAEPKRFVLVEGGSHHNTNSVGQPAYKAALAELFGLAPAQTLVVQ